MRRGTSSSAIALVAAICLPFAAAGQQWSGSSTDDPARETSTLDASPRTSRSAIRVSSRARSQVLSQAGARTNTYLPRHLRQDSAAPEEGSVPSAAKIQPTPVGPQSLGNRAVILDSQIGADVDEVIDGDWVEDGAMECDECNACETECCPPRPPCWLDGFGGVLYSGEYFIGAEAHRSLGFDDPQTENGAELDDCGFGFYGGANFGFPLNWLTCGVLSGQLGINSINTNLNAAPSTVDDHEWFVTGGFFRRVDYGLQGGVVGDFLEESWEFDPRVVQVRGELSWAFPEGYVYGFRFAKGVQDFIDDQTPAFNRQPMDHYRFFARHPICGGGYSELAGGWSEDGQGLMSMAFDVPMKECVALKSGFTYVFSDDAHDADAFNIFLGVTLRPRGASWWDYYHRPMFDVADNGSLILE